MNAVRRLILTLAMVAASFFSAGSASAVLIISDQPYSAGGPIPKGNGQFYLESTSQAAAVNGASGLSVVLGRSRAFVTVGAPATGDNLDLPTLAAITNGQGVSIPGWTMFRDFYQGGNNAVGFDGNYGYAPSPADLTGRGGQAFVNSRSGHLVSDSYSFNGRNGDTIDFEFVAGSDTGGATGHTTVRSFLVFDDTTIVEVGSAATLQGLAGDSTSGSNGGANQITRSFVAPEDFSTIRLFINMQGSNSAGESAPSIRSLVDSVSLNITAVPEPSALLCMGVAGMVALRSRRRAHRS